MCAAVDTDYNNSNNWLSSARVSSCASANTGAPTSRRQYTAAVVCSHMRTHVRTHRPPPWSSLPNRHHRCSTCAHSSAAHAHLAHLCRRRCRRRLLFKRGTCVCVHTGRWRAYT
ncbi:unnamed protein product [Sphagnum balticum]